MDTGSGGLLNGFVEGCRAGSRSEGHGSDGTAEVRGVLAFFVVGDDPVDALEDIGGRTGATTKDLDSNDIGGLCKTKGG